MLDQINTQRLGKYQQILAQTQCAQMLREQAYSFNQMQFTQDILTQINILAQNFVSFLIPFPETKPLILKGQNKQFKYDRIDAKLNKQAQKLSRKQAASVKRQHGKQRDGSITYKSYTIQFKKQLVASIREEVQRTSEPLSKIIRKRAAIQKIHPKNITRWYHTKELKKKQGGRRALYPEMQIRLAKFILSNPKMKRKLILNQAKQIMQDLQIPGRDQFNFSKGWYERFRERLSKKKVTKGAKLQDILKLQAKNEGCEVKQQYLEYDQQEDEYEDSDNDDEQLVKIQQNFNESEDRDEQYDKVKLENMSRDEKSQSTIAKQDLFFESEQEDNSTVHEDEGQTLKKNEQELDQKLPPLSKLQRE